MRLMARQAWRLLPNLQYGLTVLAHCQDKHKSQPGADWLNNR